MAVQPVPGKAIIKENIHHIIDQLQLMTYGAESQRSDLILASIAFIEVMLAEIRKAA